MADPRWQRNESISGPLPTAGGARPVEPYPMPTQFARNAILQPQLSPPVSGGGGGGGGMAGLNSAAVAHYAQQANVPVSVMAGLLQKQRNGTIAPQDLTAIAGVPPAMLPRELGGLSIRQVPAAAITTQQSPIAFDTSDVNQVLIQIAHQLAAQADTTFQMLWEETHSPDRVDSTDYLKRLAVSLSSLVEEMKLSSFESLSIFDGGLDTLNPASGLRTTLGTIGEAVRRWLRDRTCESYRQRCAAQGWPSYACIANAVCQGSSIAEGITTSLTLKIHCARICLAKSEEGCELLDSWLARQACRVAAHIKCFSDCNAAVNSLSSLLPR